MPRFDLFKDITDFNPRSPYGERPRPLMQTFKRSCNFNPRSPYGERLRHTIISRNGSNFNPRSPYGERQQKQPKSLTIFAKMRQFCKISTLGFLLSVNILRLFSQFG